MLTLFFPEPTGLSIVTYIDLCAKQWPLFPLNYSCLALCGYVGDYTDQEHVI